MVPALLPSKLRRRVREYQKQHDLQVYLSGMDRGIWVNARPHARLETPPPVISQFFLHHELNRSGNFRLA
jgi:hypothetical protein